MKPARALGRSDLGGGRGKGQGARRAAGGAAPTGRRCRRPRRTPAARRSRWTMRPSANSPMRTWRATVFAAAPDTVTGPEKGALGWHIVRVTKVTPGSEQSFDEVKDELRGRGAGRQGGRPDVRSGQQGGQRAGQWRRPGRNAERPGPGRRRRHAGCRGQHRRWHAGADPGRGRVEGRADQGGVRDAEGRSAAAGRGADAIDRRFGLLRAQRRGRDAAGGEAVRHGEGAGRGGLDARCAAARAGTGGGEAAGRGEGWPVAGRCRGGRRRDRAAHAARRRAAARPRACRRSSSRRCSR